MKNSTVTTPAGPVQAQGHAAVSARAGRSAPFSLIPQAPGHDHAIAGAAAMNILLALA